MEVPKLIGIAGRINSGKDAAGDAIRYLTEPLQHQDIKDYMTGSLLKESPYVIKKYADPLKQICADLIGCSKKSFEDRDFKSSNLGTEWSKWQFKDLETNYIKEFPNESDVDSFIRMINTGPMPKKFKKKELKMTPRLLLQLMGTDAGRGQVHDNIWVNASLAGWHADDGKPSVQRWIFTDVRFPNEVEAIEKRGGIVINIQRNHITECLTGTEVYIKLDQLYNDHSHHAPGHFVGNIVSYSTKTEPQRIQEGIDMFLAKEAPEEHFIYIEPHLSETALDNHGFKHVIINGYDYPTLIDSVKRILQQ